MLGSASVLRGNALALPLDDDSVDLCITSPPYWSLRSYQDDGRHYDGQVGSEDTPDEFIDNLLAATREMVRVTKPSGSIFVNLGDKLADKCLMLLPQRYAIRCVDELGLILRAEIVWSKPNGLPESVTDRVRRSHEVWWHFTLSPRYFSAVDEIREAHIYPGDARHLRNTDRDKTPGNAYTINGALNPLGKLPGSVWTVPTEPLRVPDHLGIDHFAAFPTEWPKRIIQGWSPAGICVECGEGRRPVVHQDRSLVDIGRTARLMDGYAEGAGTGHRNGVRGSTLANEADKVKRTITGYACACPEPTADTRPSVVLDPFGGTGTTAMVAKALGRHGITVDMSADYCRLAEWRTNDRDQLAKVLGIAKTGPADDDQLDLFGESA